MTADANFKIYNDPKVVEYYEKATGLQPCEAALFERWLKPGMAILDIGVGGGRTTPHLAQIASRYVGVDYSTVMVEACRRRFPALDVRYGDATDLSQFGDAEFDAAVFSFNGIDYLGSDEGRARCLREIARVLKQDGVFVFSSHNARVLGVWPQLQTARGLRIPWRIAYSLYATLRLAARNLASGAFWQGKGYVVDPTHGGLATYVSTPESMTLQSKAAGLKVVEMIGGRYPEVNHPYFTPWYYYACKKTSAT
jgi:SAM-dependent methyltransferase